MSHYTARDDGKPLQAFGHTLDTNGAPIRQELPALTLEGKARSIIGKWPAHPIWCGVLRLDPESPRDVVAAEVAAYMSHLLPSENCPRLLNICQRVLGVNC